MQRLALVAELLSRTNSPQNKVIIMASTHGSSSASVSGPIRGFTDPAWQYATPIPEQKNKLICKLCKKVIGGGGITRLKEHLAGVGHNVASCKNADENVKFQMKQLLQEFKKEKMLKGQMISEIRYSYGSPSSFHEEENEEGEPSTSQSKKRKGKVGLGMREFFSPRTTPGSQPGIKFAFQTKEKSEAAREALATWFFDANIPFNAVNSPYFQKALDAVCDVGPGFKGFNYHQLRGKYLHNKVTEITNYLENYKCTWPVYGCSLMADGWKDKKQRTLINFMVYSPAGAMFIKSVDASSIIKTTDALCSLFDEVVQYVGPQNIVQIITDNASNYRAAGRKLADKYGTFYWTPCAAHCIDLMLEDFQNVDRFPVFYHTIKKARMISTFIYNSSRLLNIMRKFTNGKEIIRPGATRFATNFIAVASIVQNKRSLRQMFVSDEWFNSQWSRSNAGRTVCETILDKSFWKDCEHILLVTEPLLRVLRLVDNEIKPAMGYLYHAMKTARETIEYRMERKRIGYLAYLQVISDRWDEQLSSALHVAGYYLNPRFFYSDELYKIRELRGQMIDAIMRLEPDVTIQRKINTQLSAHYQNAMGYMGCPLAITDRETMNPVMRWETYGSNVLDLQNFAIRILSQCCSATGCERNWSVFEHIHTKKRNRLEHERLNHLVFIHYNLKLTERNIRNRYSTTYADPIALDNKKLIADWICEDREDEEQLLNMEEIEAGMHWYNVNVADNEGTSSGALDEEAFDLEQFVEKILLEEPQNEKDS